MGCAVGGVSIEQQIAYCTTTDGVRIAYATYGNENAPPLVYVPDLPGQEAIWASPWGRAFIQELARHRRLITFDFRGDGASQREADRSHPEPLLADVSAVADHLGLDRFEIFSAGMAPTVLAIMFAGACPERVSKLVLFSPRAASSVADASSTESVRASYTLWSRSIATFFFPSGPPEVQRWFSTTIRSWSSAENVAATLSWVFDLSSILSSLGVPVLILHRKRSQAVSPTQIRSAASLIPGARLVTLDGDTSVPYWDYEQFSDTLYDFLGIEKEMQPTTMSSGAAVILFTDIVSSTELTERMGDARFRDASRALDTGLRAAIRHAGGAAIDGKLLGDGVLATFLSAAQAIDGARRCLELSAASDLGLHIGLHAGDVIREDNNVYGGAVNIASRICGLSAPGEILVSDVVRGMARSSAGVEFEDRGEQEMKGVGEPVRVYGVRWQE